ncbi:MAG: hypothetical protein LBR64_00755 [Dysgonamonadaceae bacterium]|jgi:hypothetical protein|nr:hypothetical protein [Dysgonamonadaceae bacterium]
MKKVNLLLLAAVLFTSCSTSKFLTSDVKPVEITDMLKIEPFAYISLIKKGNQGEYSDSVSSISKSALNESVEIFRERLHLASGEAVVIDSIDREMLENELHFLILSADRNRNIKNLPVTPVIDSLLTANGKRFGLIIVQSGFTRAKGNYNSQVAKGIGIGILTGILTMGTAAVYQAPVKSISTLYAMIIDNQNKSVAFYNKSVLQGKEPTNKENIIKQLEKVFEKYFWEK